MACMRPLLTVLLSATIAPSALAIGPLPDDVRINEVLYDGDGPDGPTVFTELWGPAGSVLDGYRLTGVNGADGVQYRQLTLDGATIAPDGLFVVVTDDARCLLLEQADQVADIDWQNGPDSVVLEYVFGIETFVVDALAYGTGPGQAGEGVPAPDVSAGTSLTRDPAHTDTNDNAADFAPATPTPGFDGPEGELASDADDDCVADATDNCPFTSNPDQLDADANGVGDACEVPPPVPEPPSLALTGLGLTALVGLCLRRRGPGPAH